MKLVGGWGFTCWIPFHPIAHAHCCAFATMSEGKRRKKRFQAFSGQLQVGGATSKSRGDRGPNPCKVFVANISFQVSYQFTGRPLFNAVNPCYYCTLIWFRSGIQVSGREMKEFFADFGAVKYCQIVKDQNGRSRG